MSWLVDVTESGDKLIDFLRKKFPDRSSRAIKSIIEKNGCFINDQLERFASTRVQRGDRINLVASILPIFANPSILYEDDFFIFLNKAPGINSDDEKLFTDLQREAPQLQLVHRLDKETSGVLLFAKSPAMFAAMVKLFKQKKVAKEYLCIVEGLFKQKKGSVKNFLNKIATYQGHTVWGKSKVGLPAQTDWQVEKEASSASLLRCFPLTGRTHQIRIHVSGLGHPIFGDTDYGRSIQSIHRPARCMLHAQKLSFIHPITGKLLAIEASLPEDFMEFMKKVDLLP